MFLARVGFGGFSVCLSNAVPFPNLEYMNLAAGNFGIFLSAAGLPRFYCCELICIKIGSCNSFSIYFFESAFKTGVTLRCCVAVVGGFFIAGFFAGSLLGFFDGLGFEGKNEVDVLAR